MYNRRTWLNPLKSDSTGSVVAFNGDITYKGELIEEMFLEISDCKNKLRLHITSDESKEDFIRKMELLRDEINMFINHLKNLNEVHVPYGN
jgi:hypothetical protein